MISVLIPARNEFLLAKTIKSILEAAEGEIEIIAVLDGCRDMPKVEDDPRVTLIRHSEPIGQRAGVNEAARLAKGKYILKTDGHSWMDKGFDVKLAEDCEYDWTVIPRMYNLHAFDWVCKNGHRYYQDKADPHKTNQCPECREQLKIEHVWKIRKHKRTDFMYMDNDLRVQYWHAYEKRPESKGDIADVMNGQGACWFQHKDRFWELGGLDETHGMWGQVGVEVACKAWLSGGRHVVNKKTWFSHMFRTTGEFTFPYKIRGRDQENARRYSRDLWLNNKWPMQKRDFNWLLDKFFPVPTWDDIPKNVPKQEIPVSNNGEYFTDTMNVDGVWESRIKHSEHTKTKEFLEKYTQKHPEMSDMMRLKASPNKAVENFFESFRDFTRKVLDGRDFDPNQTDYYNYETAHLNPHDLLPTPTNKGRRHVKHKMINAIKLITDIRDNGLKDPLEMWLDKKGNRILRKGFRRLTILKELGVHKFPVMVWRDEETFWRNQTGHIPKRWRKRFAKQ
jgi:glycosyltransferase involved in cell wall biosynthesis